MGHARHRGVGEGRQDRLVAEFQDPMWSALAKIERVDVSARSRPPSDALCSLRIKALVELP